MKKHLGWRPVQTAKDDPKAPFVERHPIFTHKADAVKAADKLGTKIERVMVIS